MCYRYNAGAVPELFRENCKSDENYSPGSTWPTFFILFNNSFESRIIWTTGI